MRITKEIHLENFEAWAGARENLIRWMQEKPAFVEYLEESLEEITAERLLSETELNDFLWFEAPLWEEQWDEEQSEEA